MTDHMRDSQDCNDVEFEEFRGTHYGKSNERDLDVDSADPCAVRQKIVSWIDDLATEGLKRPGDYVFFKALDGILSSISLPGDVDDETGDKQRIRQLLTNGAQNNVDGEIVDAVGYITMCWEDKAKTKGYPLMIFEHRSGEVWIAMAHTDSKDSSGSYRVQSSQMQPGNQASSAYPQGFFESTKAFIHRAH